MGWLGARGLVEGLVVGAGDPVGPSECERWFWQLAGFCTRAYP